MHRQFGRSPLEIGGLRAVPASPLKPSAENQKRELPTQARQGPPDFPIESNYRTIHRISRSKAAP